jgi:hypothetical protein
MMILILLGFAINGCTALRSPEGRQIKPLPIHVMRMAQLKCTVENPRALSRAIETPGSTVIVQVLDGTFHSSA